MEILIKQNLAIDGHVRTYTNFFGARSSKRSVDIQKLSKLECEIMAQSKTCNGFFNFDENPIEYFKWLSTVLTTGYYCRLQKTKLRYKNKIFNEICNADNLECNLGDSILIWNKKIVNSCPYRLFSSLKLNLPYDNILSNPIGNQMFKNIYETSEGLFLTYIKSNLILLSESENAVHDLLLADSDRIELKTFTMIDKIKEEICNYKLSTIRAFREHEDMFNILYTGLGSLVLFTRDGIIFAPNCSKISSINLNSYSDCSLDPQIEYSENDKVVKDKTFNCNNKRNWIRKIGAKIAIINKINVTIINSFTINSLDSELDKLTFGHDSSINTNIIIYSSDFDTKFLHNINGIEHFESIKKIINLPEFASKEENKWILDEWKKLTFNKKVILIKQKYPNHSIDNVKSQINLTNIMINDAEDFIKKNDGYKQLRKLKREQDANKDSIHDKMFEINQRLIL
ncbi:hypothetical protein BpHYR1_025164 [Brachionus plicatilis]|uniref:Uncharacterized protein n=1 Tax=Brachionus plicatilis TaxID=10195 RepID=A0A3M7Q7M9_BRAPC|nr:hypothetical protein BpHYR1_025164 [Brachionus plicatilis]